MKTYQIEETFLADLANAYITYDATKIIEQLSDDFCYASFWITAPDLTKLEYIKYIKGKLNTMKQLNVQNKFFMMYQNGTGKPILLIGQRTPEGDFGCFVAESNSKGKIKSLNITPSRFYNMGYKSKEEFDDFMASIK